MCTTSHPALELYCLHGPSWAFLADIISDWLTSQLSPLSFSILYCSSILWTGFSWGIIGGMGCSCIAFCLKHMSSHIHIYKVLLVVLSLHNAQLGKVSLCWCAQCVKCSLRALLGRAAMPVSLSGLLWTGIQIITMQISPAFLSSPQNFITYPYCSAQRVCFFLQARITGKCYNLVLSSVCVCVFECLSVLVFEFSESESGDGRRLFPVSVHSLRLMWFR